MQFSLKRIASTQGLRLAVFLALVCALSGCGTARQSYEQSHPELSPEHRKIILAGRIKYGDPVVGMTKEQVRMVMGADPDQFDAVNGEDAWIWVRTKGIGQFQGASDADNGGSARQGGGGPRQENEQTKLTENTPTRTTVFFKGNVATRLEVRSGSL